MNDLKWIGNSKSDLLEFPKAVTQEIGYALYLAQGGGMYRKTKPFKGCGSGVYEIVSDFDKNTYRAVYIVNLNNCVYVLHCFQKKSKTGIQTPKEEVDMISRRLKFLKTQLKSR